MRYTGSPNHGLYPGASNRAVLSVCYGAMGTLQASRSFRALIKGPRPFVSLADSGTEKFGETVRGRYL